MPNKRMGADEMERLYLEGKTFDEITEIGGFKSKGYVRTRLVGMGYKENTKVDVGKVLALYKARWKIEDIAKDCCVPVAVVRKVLEKNVG